MRLSGFAADDWITMKGSHIEVGEGGEILHGAGGKFKNIKDVPRNTVKQRKGETMEELRARAKKELGAGSGKPDYVKNVDSIKSGEFKGIQMPKGVALPESANELEGFFEKMRIQMSAQGTEHYLAARRKHVFYGPWRKENDMTDMYQDLRNFAKERNSMSGMSSQARQERTAKCFEYAEKEPSGAGKWLATEIYNSEKNNLPSERRSAYEKKIASWK